MALGFILPKVDFISITLDGGTDLLKKTDEPHIAQVGETDIVSADITNPSQENGQNVEPMSVDIIFSIEITLDMSSSNNFSVFFEDDFIKYLKIRAIQSTNESTTRALLDANPRGNAFRPSNLENLETKTGITVQTIDFSSYDGSIPGEDATLASFIEVKTTPTGKKSYCMPYRVRFEIPSASGGVKVDHLAYLVVPFVDIKELLLDKASLGSFPDNLTLPDSIVNGIMPKAISSQVVIQGGSTNNFAQIFYETPMERSPEGGLRISPDAKPTGPAWLGEVHYHGPENPGPNGYIGYMGGHESGDMGPYLTPSTVLNGTIQDFREVRELEKISFDYSLFSNSWINEKTTEKLYNNLKGMKDLAGQDNPYMKDTEDIETAIVKSLGGNKNPPIFTEFNVSMDGRGDIRYIFGINFKEAIRQNSAFPKLVNHIFDNGTPQEIEDFLDRKILDELRIYRHRVSKENPADPTVDLYEKVPNESPKLVCAAGEGKNGFLIPNKMLTPGNSINKGAGSIAQILLTLPANENNSLDTKFYTGGDVGIPNDGHYIYSLEATMQDPIIDWMAARIVALKIELYGLEGYAYGFKDYVERAKEKPEYYNLYTNRFTQYFIDEIEAQVGLSFVETKIMNFFEILSSFVAFDSNDKFYSLFNFLKTISSPNFGSPSGALKAIEAMENIHNRILDAFSSVSKYKKPVDSQHVESVYSAGSNPDRKFTIKKKFETKIKGEINHLTGYDYLSQNNTIAEETSIAKGLKTLTYAQYNDRATKELNKIFPNPPQTGENLGTFNTIKIYKTPLADSLITSQDFASIISNLYQDLLKKQRKVDSLKEFVDQAQQELDAIQIPPASQGGAGAVLALIQAAEAKLSVTIPPYENALEELRDVEEQIKTQEAGEAGLKAFQGEVLNPDDSVEFTKTAFLSPSIINFADSQSHNMLQNGNIRTDVENLNNILMNIIKHNMKLGQKFDMTLAAHKGDKNRSQFELKYDLMNILNDSQATIRVATSANSAINSPSTPVGTNFGPVLGGSTSNSGEIVQQLPNNLLSNATLVVGENEAAGSTLQSALSPSSIATDPGDMLSSKINPSDLLLSITNQKIFEIFSDEKWTWEYYVQNFQDTFYMQYAMWYNFANYYKNISQGFGNTLLNPIDPFILDNSPLKRAPNHVKSLMLHLDWTKNFINSDFEELKNYLKQKKPYAYNYELTEAEVSHITINGTYNFLGVAPNANQSKGITNYPKTPKMKVLYETPEFVSFFLLNYKNIVKVEVLTGYNYDGNGNVNTNDPIWSLLTDEVFEGYRESEGYALCRITPYENEFYGIKNHEILQMPIYNDFFFINFNEPPAPESVALQTRRTKGRESIAKIVASRALSKRTPSASLGVVFDFLKRTRADSPPTIRSEQLRSTSVIRGETNKRNSNNNRRDSSQSTAADDNPRDTSQRATNDNDTRDSPQRSTPTRSGRGY